MMMVLRPFDAVASLAAFAAATSAATSRVSAVAAFVTPSAAGTTCVA